MDKKLPLVVILLFLSFNVFASKFTIGIAVWSGYPESVRGFKDGLASKGLNEGEHIDFIEGATGADKKLQRRVAERFKKASVDLVYTLTTPGTSIVKEVMPETTPIVFSIVTYPADSGLIESFEYSGNNLVGTSNYVPMRHYLKLLKLILPWVKSVAIFHRKGEPNSKIQAANMLRLLKHNGIKGINREPENIAQVKSMATALIGHVDVFMTTTDTLMQSGGEHELIKISLKNNVPILSSNKAGILKGSSFGPVADFYTLGKMAGVKAAEILKNGVEPTRIESDLQDPPLLLVNRSTIKKLGIILSDPARKVITWVN
ncbi:MAG: ABC transporter substrate-binding protein [Pseudomonadales bacterium]